MESPKLTKIVATISDLKCEVEFLKTLHAAGMNVVRINSAHVEPSDALRVIQNTRAASDKLAILIDTKGPEMRNIKPLAPVAIVPGKTYRFEGDPTKNSTDDIIYVTHKDFGKDVTVGSKVLIDDGCFEFETIEQNAKENYVICKALNGGTLNGRKSINVPGVKVTLPTLNEKDKRFIDFAIEQDVEFIAHSFVRDKSDVIAIQQLLDAKKSEIKIIAKIEDQQGVANIDEILDHVYGIMIARGDLGVELPAEEIPVVQRELLRKCIERRKPVIVATQMLHTMIDNPRPTRAEVSDVANAVYQGADAIMLSGETAQGKYPVEAVTVMDKIARRIEEVRPEITGIPVADYVNETAAYLTEAAAQAAMNLEVSAIVADSFTGGALRNISGFRPKKPIYALCYTPRVAREMALSYGVIAESFAPSANLEEPFMHTRCLYEGISEFMKNGFLKSTDKICVISGNFGRNIGATFFEVTDIKNIPQLVK